MNGISIDSNNRLVMNPMGIDISRFAKVPPAKTVAPNPAEFKISEPKIFGGSAGSLSDSKFGSEDAFNRWRRLSVNNLSETDNFKDPMEEFGFDIEVGEASVGVVEPAVVEAQQEVQTTSLGTESQDIALDASQEGSVEETKDDAQSLMDEYGLDMEADNSVQDASNAPAEIQSNSVSLSNVGEMLDMGAEPAL